ncbi:MAG TPA: PUA domain-containing protein, partial [Corynebacterium sp.]|nr:PUA domain-containing protein [Corynebacterium sp.]
EGILRLDQGAVRAVTSGGTSLLPVGITSTSGDFKRGDIVDIVGPDGEVLGRGEVNYDSEILEDMLGKHSDELPENRRRPVVHADYLSNYATRL